MAVVDFDYLEGVVGGDLSIALEVLAIFRQQAETWLPALVEDGSDWRAVAHTVKGAARGVGASALGEAAEAAEFGTAAELAAVREALGEALAAIAAYEAEKSTASSVA